MSEPPLTRFLALPTEAPLAHIDGVLRDVQDGTATAAVPDRPAELEAWSLERVATLLAVESALSPAEIRARIREDLFVEMSRVPIDGQTLAAELATDPALFRARIDGQAPLTVGEYVRIRTVLSEDRERS